MPVKKALTICVVRNSVAINFFIGNIHYRLFYVKYWLILEYFWKFNFFAIIDMKLIQIECEQILYKIMKYFSSKHQI